MSWKKEGLKREELKREGKLLREKLSKKRVGGKHKKGMFISVQLLSSEPCGKTQKYSRISALESVEIEEESLSNIKQTCISYFSKAQTICDILMSEIGPSVCQIGQISLKKVVQIRFIDLEDNREEQKIERKKAEKVYLTEEKPSSSTSVTRSVPRSVSMSQNLKAGQLILPKKSIGY